MTSDTFKTEELFLLISAFGGETVFGLPGRTLFELEGNFEEAHKNLMAKNILNESGQITDGGALVVEALEVYQKCQNYIRLNQFLFGFSETNPENAYILIEIEENKAYRFEVLDKVFVLALLRNHFPLLRREISEEETTFLTKKLTFDERKRAAEAVPDERFLSMEFFRTKEIPREESNPKFYQQFFVFVWHERLIAVDVEQNEYYEASGYWLLGKLYEEMKFPEKEVL
ncbi:hypothetical protein MFLO_01930 [Listeria floridensis FSL S10-1187]|uniref:DUF5081 domain-containing protein n=1 Tax=Listeria floridensis FSL S10-1187 TaxID=1265817 RepID=A0ABN0RIY5_9LIST|nr:DUF5081 family protein [Listeria floridensis]EUJ33938.1 hypothetical protein MFLO_01930 [Listeria floridensis FSL S10-1187]